MQFGRDWDSFQTALFLSGLRGHYAVRRAGLTCRVRFFEHLLIGKAIANVNIGEQVDGPRWIILDFFAKLADKRPQILYFFAAICAPYRCEQPGIRHYATGAAHEAVENVELLACEVNRLVAPCDQAPRRIQLDLAD